MKIKMPRPLKAKFCEQLQQAVTNALSEDLGPRKIDLTTKALLKKATAPVTATIFSKHPTPVIVAGTDLAQEIFRQLKQKVHIQIAVGDGEQLRTEQTLMTLTGAPQALLAGERTLLNFLRHLSAIATLTRRFVETARCDIEILDTRKTTPGLRYLEKYAVLCGGGHNHRLGLYDALLIKNNHIDFLGGLPQVLKTLPQKIPKNHPLVVEVRNLEEAEEAIAFGRGRINRLLLDNMPLKLMKECVVLCRGIFSTEASGGIDLHNIAAVAATGVDAASVGLLTYGAGQVDLSMHMRKHV